MITYYLDASALVKRYAPEDGSIWVITITEPSAGHTILLSEITLAEVAAALAAKHRAPQGLTIQERDRALGRFLVPLSLLSPFLQGQRGQGGQKGQREHEMYRSTISRVYYACHHAAR